jgi:hypothetical protein
VHHGSPARKKGDAITYRGAHARVVYERGEPELCEMCGRNGPIEGRKRSYGWALSHELHRLPLLDVRGRVYSADPADYIRLCVPCHGRYDQEGRPRTFKQADLYFCGS